MGRTDSILSHFQENAPCRDANSLSAISICQQYQKSAFLEVLAVLCCHLVTENVMIVLHRKTAGCGGVGGCASHHSLLYLVCCL